MELACTELTMIGEVSEEEPSPVEAGIVNSKVT